MSRPDFAALLNRQQLEKIARAKGCKDVLNMPLRQLEKIADEARAEALASYQQMTRRETKRELP